MCFYRKQHADKNSALTEMALEHVNAKIVEMAVYAIDLPMKSLGSLFEKMMTHHVVLTVGDNGTLHTFEKIPSCLLVQSCHRAVLSPDELVRLRDGQKRKKLKTMVRLVQDSQPKDKTVGVMLFLIWYR